MKSVASVTINDAMRRPVMNEALIAPKVTPIRTMGGIETKSGTSGR
jgi:hypothetical protein